MRAYANEPDNALKKTTAREIAVTNSAGSFGQSHKRMRTRRNPPPPPMRVPKAPINKPRGSNHKYSRGMSKRLFSFQLKFRETRLHTHHLIVKLGKARARRISRCRSGTSNTYIIPPTTRSVGRRG